MDATVMNYKGREPPVTCQKFGSGVAHTLISRQEVREAMRSEAKRSKENEAKRRERSEVKRTKRSKENEAKRRERNEADDSGLHL